MKKVVTLRLDERDAVAVDYLQHLTGEKTASKAILLAVRLYPAHQRQKREADDLRRERDQFSRALENYLP